MLFLTNIIYYNLPKRNVRYYRGLIMNQLKRVVLLFFVSSFVILAAFSIFSLPGGAVESTEQTQSEKTVAKEHHLEAIEKLKAELSQDPKNIKLMIKIAERYGWANQPKEAVPFYEKAHEMEPDNLEILYKLRDFYGWAGQSEKAIEVTEKILTKEPENVELRTKLAKQYGWSKRKKDSIREWEKVLSVAPDDLEARKNLADMYAWDGQTDKAVKEYEEILKREPDNLKYREKLAFHCMWNGRREEAEHHFKEILKRDPAHVKARQGLGDVYSYSARGEQAITEYLRALDNIVEKGDEVAVYTRLARNYQRTQALDKSKEYYDRVLIDDPSNVDALAGLEEIRKKLRPEVFSRFDTTQRKNDYDKERYAVGFRQRTLDAYDISGHYIQTRREDEQQDHIDDYIYHTMGFEVFKDHPDGFRTGGGIDLNVYEINDSVEVDYFLQVIRYEERITGSLTYRKQTEDSEEDDLEQEVDRHSLSASLYFRLNEHLDFSTLWEGRYLTEGNAPDENWGLIASMAPILHVSQKPRIDLSLIYYRANFLRQNPSFKEQYEYYNPEKEEVISANVFFRHEFSKQLRVSATDALVYGREDDHWNHTTRVEIALHPDEDQKLSVVYYKSLPVFNSPDDYNREQQWTINYSRVF